MENIGREIDRVCFKWVFTENLVKEFRLWLPTKGMLLTGPKKWDQHLSKPRVRTGLGRKEKRGTDNGKNLHCGFCGRTRPKHT